tara:strand:+ start:466 stop:768 length:303 start_codon:yes stop_codon:yes gene_type:complete
MVLGTLLAIPPGVVAVCNLALMVATLEWATIEAHSLYKLTIVTATVKVGLQLLHHLWVHLSNKVLLIVGHVVPVLLLHMDMVVRVACLHTVVAATAALEE